ncbi:hypothetical protein K9F62_16950 [Desulfovibrio sp. JY]|nr:hypothetical protein K9F62_16950 [Desulfovibrio sp. JY]
MTYPLLSRVKQSDWFFDEYTSPNIPRDVAWSRFYLAARHPVWKISKLRFLGLSYTDVYHWIYLTIIDANKRGLAHQVDASEMWPKFEQAREMEREKIRTQEAEQRRKFKEQEEQSKALWRAALDVDAVRRNYPHLFEPSSVPTPKRKVVVRVEQLRLFA